jgi:hypothetical protein
METNLTKNKKIISALIPLIVFLTVYSVIQFFVVEK